jgi:hypothetical protein
LCAAAVQVLVLSSNRLFYQEVLMFSHQEEMLSDYLTVHTHTGFNLTATPGHYIWVRTHNQAALQMLPMSSLKVGDQLMAVNATHLTMQPATVVAVTKSRQAGLYKPHTMSGSTIVDNLAALTFTSSILPSLFLHKVLMVPVWLLHLTVPDFVLDAINAIAFRLYFSDAIQATLLNLAWLNEAIRVLPVPTACA